MFRFHVSRKLRMHADPLLQQLLYQLKSDCSRVCVSGRGECSLLTSPLLPPASTAATTRARPTHHAHRHWPHRPRPGTQSVSPGVVAGPHRTCCRAHSSQLGSCDDLLQLSQPIAAVSLPYEGIYPNLHESHYRTRASTPISMNRARVTVSVLVRPSSVLPRPVRWSTQPCPPYVPPRPVRWSTQPVRPAHA